MGRWLAVIVLFVFFGSITAGGASLYRAKLLAKHPVVAITFDDAPTGGGLWPGETRVGIATRLTEALRANHVKGVYGFVVAEDLEGDPDAQEALRILVRNGMRIGNHTFSHPSLTDVTAATYIREIARDEPALAEYAEGRNWHWFRYPYLCEGDTLEKRYAVRDWLQQHHYRIAQVTLSFDDDDWDDAYGRCSMKHDQAGLAWLQQSYLNNAAEDIRLGRQEEKILFGHEIPNVLLLHETAFTTLMLPDLLKLMRKEGFRFEPLDRVQRDPAYALDPDAALKDGGSLPNQFMNSRRLKYPPFTPEPVDRLNNICR